MRFRWYIDGSDDPWRSWYDAQDKRVQAKHDVAMRFLEGGNWRTPHFRSLTNYDGLGEIKISARVEHRLIGYRGPAGFDFTVLMWCTHKGKQYDPKDALNTAYVRYKSDEQSKLTTCGQPKPIPSPRPASSQNHEWEGEAGQTIRKLRGP
jgi:hypothetical protein